MVIRKPVVHVTHSLDLHDRSSVLVSFLVIEQRKI